MKICLIRQPAGLGDIFFTLKIAKKIILSGVADKVYWPVTPSIDYIKDYIKFENLVFCSTEDDFPYKNIYQQNPRHVINQPDLLYIPLQCADQMDNDLILKTKYNILQAKWGDWYNFFKFERNKEKENELFYNILKLRDNEPYTIINNTYGTPPHSLSLNISIPNRNNERQVYITQEHGYTVFDWCKVFENATIIHTVDTCFTYICEIIDIKAQEMFLYSRTKKPETPSYTQTSFIWNKPWQYLQL